MIQDAVVLAAGMGTRLATDGDATPKPLRKVAGVTLLKRTILTLAAGGIRRVAVIVGYQADAIERSLRGDAGDFARAGVAVRCVDNPEFMKSNGVSVVCAKSAVRGPFVLTMSDHVYDETLPRLTSRADLRRADLYLCVDRNVADVYDPDDATKVVTERGYIVDIGKQLTSYDCIDCGVFAVTPALIDALETVRATRGDCSLSDGVKLLASHRRARVIDVGDVFWQDVDTPHARARAEGWLATLPAMDAVIRQSTRLSGLVA
jgi:choline kinase